MPGLLRFSKVPEGPSFPLQGMARTPLVPSQAAESSHPRSVTPRLVAHRLIDEPPVTGGVPTRPSGVEKQRGEPLHPAIDGDEIDLDIAFGLQLLDGSVRQPVAQAPANRDRAHLRRKPEPGERRPRRMYWIRATTHRPSLPEPAIGERNSVIAWRSAVSGEGP
jgi:hypothetical protein